ncbi:MAG: methylenetetrahydrofolate reductase [Candidatus Thioglobus sp.]|nr:methylenetetrahydrofolate reductase [Candidatus Thioglobus sp.]
MRNKKSNIDIPITKGIIPITNYDQLNYFSKTCGAEIPDWILNKLNLYKNDLNSLKEFGEDVVSEMNLKLKDNGVSSFHFYCLNKAEPTLSIVKKLLKN